MNSSKFELNKTTSAGTSGGIGFSGILTIVFIVLKLLGKIDWPWVWVLSPLWISAALVIVVIIVAFIIFNWLLK